MIELYYPLKPIRVNQAFGENQNAFYKQAGMKGHSGIDFWAYNGQPIYATHDGVCYPQVDSHGGNGVKLQGDGFETIYWHFIDDDAVVHTKQVVKAGDLLGYADNTGQSTGTHLHFGLRIGETSFKNGYGGCSDPQPYFNGKYAEEIQNPLPPPPKYVFNRILRKGMWNMDVVELQKFLNKQGNTLVLDGIFGIKTETAVKNFQTKSNLVADGIVGAMTNAKINLLT